MESVRAKARREEVRAPAGESRRRGPDEGRRGQDAWYLASAAPGGRVGEAVDQVVRVADPPGEAGPVR